MLIYLYTYMHCVKTPLSPKQDEHVRIVGSLVVTTRRMSWHMRPNASRNTTRKPVKGNMCVTSVEVNIQNPTGEDSRNIWQIV